jgi:hypothetical protein
MRPLGLKPALILELYAALKRRSSTVLRALVGFSAVCGSWALPEPSLLPRPHLSG